MTRTITDSHMTCISTKYYGPGNVRGSRVKVNAGMKRIKWVNWDDALGVDENHDAAALALCDEFGWKGNLIKGGTETGNVYVFEPRP